MFSDIHLSVKSTLNIFSRWLNTSLFCRGMKVPYIVKKLPRNSRERLQTQKMLFTKPVGKEIFLKNIYIINKTIHTIDTVCQF